VVFRYPGAQNLALNKASFTIEEGTVVGIVGRSGSGKTTLTKLIQGLYPLQEGLVRFDGIDAREIELSHLRRQIGVVLQENFLFRGTVRENLSVTKPDATFEELVAAAQAAGADEFIERLPQGYDTVLEENATNLSAARSSACRLRARWCRVRILILDEAASALDPESEAIINNLSKIAVGRTVVMISHRLSTLVTPTPSWSCTRARWLIPAVTKNCSPVAKLTSTYGTSKQVTFKLQARQEGRDRDRVPAGRRRHRARPAAEVRAPDLARAAAGVRVLHHLGLRVAGREDRDRPRQAGQSAAEHRGAAARYLHHHQHRRARARSSKKARCWRRWTRPSPPPMTQLRVRLESLDTQAPACAPNCPASRRHQRCRQQRRCPLQAQLSNERKANYEAQKTKMDQNIARLKAGLETNKHDRASWPSA
jgi:energy-coupling factor transporter ATP-binding protein EcfA2